jgi:hypothetical protein
VLCGRTSFTVTGERAAATTELRRAASRARKQLKREAARAAKEKAA